MQEPKELKIKQLDIEVYDWKTGDYVADFSNILSNGLRVNWKLNDTEEFDFGLDYDQFKLKCQEMGVDAKQVLSPGVHDVKVRYNGRYIVGGRVVSVDINLNNSSNSTMQIKCLGFLDLFRDQITNAQYSRKTYAQIARSLVADSQKPLAINKTPNPEINTSSWLIQGSKDTNDGRTYMSDIGKYCILVRSPSNGTWCALSTRIRVPAGTCIDITWRQRIDTSVTGGKLVERKEVGHWQDQIHILDLNSSDFTGTWKNMSVKNYYVESDNPWIRIETLGSGGAALRITDFKITYNFDKNEYYDQRVSLGADTASLQQSSTRQRGYELQNVKQAITSLTRLENDNFDFQFTPHRQFNTYAKKGAEKLDVEVTYPGNIDSGTISHSIADIANYSYVVGSGIGDERLEAVTHSSESRHKYGHRVNIKTLNDVKLFPTLYEHSLGVIQDGQWPDVIPSLSVADSSLNPLTLETGDTIMVRLESDPYLEQLTQKYRVTGINWTINNDLGESMSLDLVRAEKPQKSPVMIRYIKDILNGSTANTGNHWVQIQAIEMDGDREINRALGKSVVGFPAINNGNRITNGNLTAGDFANHDGVKTAVIVDLGRPYPIDYVRVFHFYADGRKYNTDGCTAGLVYKPGFEPLDITLWGHWPYVERSSGRKSRWIQLENT